MLNETPIVFECLSKRLVGILHKPESKPSYNLGVLILVGGGQYRVGSHRQFVLLARYLAERGVSVMRFDYRGMGDSEGDQISFEECEPDLKSAIDKFYAECPELDGVVIWGLCDAASAAVFYAHQDPRVKGLVLLNPWVNSEDGEAKAYVKHYYLSRLLNGHMWRKILTGKFDFKNSFADFFHKLKLIVRKQKNTTISQRDKTLFNKNISIADRMFEGLSRFNGKTLIILSGNDLTANQFRDLTTGNPEWKKLMKSPMISDHIIDGADHTFSSNIWKEKVESLTDEWLKSIGS